ncbi:MAG: choice-of-anchor J domain-containing protein, partial [Oscillospiraceae bacterium]
MRTRKLLNKALSFLLSGTMLAGMIPAVSVTAGAETYGEHTVSGYTNEWSYSFENGFDGTKWSSEDKDGDTYGWYVDTSATLPHCGSKFMCSDSTYLNDEHIDEKLNPDNWLYSPLIQLSEDKEYQLTFYAYGYNNTFGVYIAVGRYSTDYVQIGDDYTITDNQWNQYTIDLSEYAGKYIHLAFVHHNNSGLADLFLDCVDISSRPKGYTMVRSWDFENTVFEGDDIVANVPSSFISADLDDDGDCWEVVNVDWYSHSGDCSLRSRNSSSDNTMNNWLRLPAFVLGTEQDFLLTFYVTNSHAGQSVDVYVYGTLCYDYYAEKKDLDGDEETEYYSKVLTENIDVTSTLSGWSEVRVDLSDYANQNVYVAIVQNGGEGEMRVDDIALWEREAHTPDGDRTNVYFEGFENSEATLPSGWDTIDKDGDGYNWYAFYSGFSGKFHHGNGRVCSESYKGEALSPDNWLIMPEYTVSTTKITTLTFEAVGSHYTDYSEVFGVYISVDDGEFEQIGTDYTTSYVWKEIEVDLTPYAGKSVRVAVVHHHCTNQDMLLLDCFNIWEEPFPPIEAIDITVDRPMIGETVPISTVDYAKLTAASHDITCDSNGCLWMKTSKEDYENIESPKYTAVTSSETFSADYVYVIYANFQLDEGYSFADDVKITVNGVTHTCKTGEEHTGNIIAVSVAFYPLEAFITDVAVTVTEPVVGAVPDTAPTVVTTPDTTSIEHYAAWGKALKEDYTDLTGTPWEQITDPAETFAEG